MRLAYFHTNRLLIELYQQETEIRFNMMCLKFANHPVRMYAKYSFLKNLHVRKKNMKVLVSCAPPPPPTKYQTTRSLMADLTVCECINGLKVNLIRAAKSERSQE